MAMKDLYKIIGVPEDATDDAIKQAYRKLARQLHPDVTGGDKRKTERFKEVNEAYAVLGESGKRKEYDRLRHAPVGADGLPEGFDMDSFARAFGGRPAGRGRRGDEEFDLNDLFGSLFGGGARGAGPGMRWEVRTHGGEAPFRRPAPQPERPRPSFTHPHLRAEGDQGDVLLDLPLTLAEATMGAKISVPTLDGPVTVTVPPGTSGGARLRLRGRGLPRPQGVGGRGDQHCRIDIAIPKAWATDAEAQRLVRELGRIGTAKPRPF